jgi:hypothetical protein
MVVIWVNGARAGRNALGVRAAEVAAPFRPTQTWQRLSLLA